MTVIFYDYCLSQQKSITRMIFFYCASKMKIAHENVFNVNANRLYFLYANKNLFPDFVVKYDPNCS